MALPISSVVNVNIAVSPAFKTEDGFGNMLILTAGVGMIGEPMDQVTRYKEYASILEVGADWATSSEVYKMAGTFFSQAPSPTKCSVGLIFLNELEPILKGNLIEESITSVYSMVDGSFSITIGETTQEITLLDFAGASASTEDDIAAVIQAGLQAASSGSDEFFQATCVWNTDHFEIRGGFKGANETIDYVTEAVSGTYIGTLLNIEYGSSALANGTSAETVTAALNAISQKNNAYYGIALEKSMREKTLVNSEVAVTAAASFAEANSKMFGTTTNTATAITASTTDILTALALAEYNNTFCVYSSTIAEYPECSVMGRLFTVDYTPANSAITLMFKQLPGITQENLSSSEASILIGKGGNVFDSVGGNAMYTAGQQVNGRFTDEVHALAWLKSELENEVFAAMYLASTKIPYTNGGVAILVQAMRGVLDRAYAGDVLGEGQLSDGTIVPNGYIITTLPVSQVPTADKEQRLYNYLGFKALGSGAIHGVTINGTFER